MPAGAACAEHLLGGGRGQIGPRGGRERGVPRGSGMAAWVAAVAVAGAVLAGGAVPARAHITMSPSSGFEPGGYGWTELKIPHGTAGLLTTRFEVDIPHGVLSVKPQMKPGWTTTMEERDITPYMSHGKEVSKAPSKVIYQVDQAEDALPNENVDVYGLNIKLACEFTDATQQSVWLGQPALWLPTRQMLSPPGSLEVTETLSWTGIGSGEDSWSLLKPKPAPYIMLDGPAPRCTDMTTGLNTFDFLGQMNETDGMSGEYYGPGAGLTAEVESFVEVQIDDVYRDLLARIQALEERLATVEAN